MTSPDVLGDGAAAITQDAQGAGRHGVRGDEHRVQVRVFVQEAGSRRSAARLAEVGVGHAVVLLNPTRPYRLVLTGQGPNLSGQLRGGGRQEPLVKVMPKDGLQVRVHARER